MINYLNSLDNKESVFLLNKIKENIKNKEIVKDKLVQNINKISDKIFEEKEILDYLNLWLGDNYIFLHNLRLRYNKRTAYINYLVISKKAVFLLETTNFSTNIKVNKYGEWIRYNYNNHGQEIQEGIPSPVEDNRKNAIVINDFLNLKSKAFITSTINIPVLPIVVLGNPKAVIERNKENENLVKDIVKLESLDKFINKKEIELQDILSAKDMNLLAQLFLEYNIPIQIDFVDKLELQKEHFRVPLYFNRLIGKPDPRGNLICYSCNKPMDLNKGIFSTFWRCSNHPICKTTVPYEKYHLFEKEHKITYNNNLSYKKENKFNEGYVFRKEDLQNNKKDKKKEKIPKIINNIKNIFIKSSGVCEHCGGKMIKSTDASDQRILICDDFPKCQNIIYIDS